MICIKYVTDKTELNAQTGIAVYAKWKLTSVVLCFVCNVQPIKKPCIAARLNSTNRFMLELFGSVCLIGVTESVITLL
jgi:hypothetical protein